MPGRLRYAEKHNESKEATFLEIERADVRASVIDRRRGADESLLRTALSAAEREVKG